MLQCSFWSTFLYNQKRMWIKSTILHFIAVLTSLLKIKVHKKMYWMHYWSLMKKSLVMHFKKFNVISLKATLLFYNALRFRNNVFFR